MILRPALAFACLVALAACNRQPEPSPAPTPPLTPAPLSSPSASPSAAALSRFVGHYPFDKIGEGSFMADAAVRRAVEAVVPDKAIRDDVLSSDATATPIVEKDGRLLAWACEPHNCGPHNWTIAITPDGGNAAVCYHDEDRTRWFPEGFEAPPGDGCPSGDNEG